MSVRETGGSYKLLPRKPECLVIIDVVLRVNIVESEPRLEDVAPEYCLRIKDRSNHLEVWVHREIRRERIGDVQDLTVWDVLLAHVVKVCRVNRHIQLAPVKFLR